MAVFDRLKGLFAPAEEEQASMQPKMTKERITEAMATLQKYRSGKQNLERRIVENEQFYKLRYDTPCGDGDIDFEPRTAWLLNCIANKHADAMDNYPAPNVLPREDGDREDAKQLSSVLPVVLEQNGFEQTYSDMWWYKLKAGTGVYGVFWDNTKSGGLGDIDIRSMDLLNLFWEPGVKDIQDSRNFFSVELADNDELEAAYPILSGKLGGNGMSVTEYVHDDTIDTTGKTLVVDWYYKDRSTGKDVLHYCKFAGGEVLYASEDVPEYAERGYYDHGKYPFVFDTLFVAPDSPAGFGYVDVCKNPQVYIDKLNKVILRNAVMATTPRFFARKDGAINIDEYADWTKPFVTYQGSGDPNDNIVPIKVPTLPSVYVNILTNKIEELKETSGNRDFSQGGTTSGVTAASAIAALQEAGSKLSRDMLKSSYRAFTQVCYIAIELMRQFYDEGRYFRIQGDNGAEQFVKFDNAGLKPKPQGNDFGQDMGYRLPIYDIKVIAQKSNAFSTLAENERAKELYGMGFFNPDMSDQALAALEMMDFERIDMVKQKVAQNGTMLQIIQQLQAQVAQLAQIVDAQNGTTLSTFTGAEQSVSTPTGGGGGSGIETNPLGGLIESARNTTANTARERTLNASAVQ